MHNGFNQAYNMMPKENSKAQKAKAANKLPVKCVVCADCGRGDVTLYKSDIDGKRYCKEHLPTIF